jgi:hypothetical protein
MRIRYRAGVRRASARADNNDRLLRLHTHARMVPVASRRRCAGAQLHSNTTISTFAIRYRRLGEDSQTAQQPVQVKERQPRLTHYIWIPTKHILIKRSLLMLAKTHKQRNSQCRSKSVNLG